MLCSAARPIAFLIGGFTLVNLLAAAATGFNANRWWIDTRPLPPWVGAALLGLAATAFLAFAITPHAGPVRRVATIALAIVLVAIALANAAGFYRLLARDEIRSSFPVPLSLGVAAALAIVAVGVTRPAACSVALPPVIVGLALVAFPLAQIACFGSTDYRRDADAIVVFGARAYADGRPSQALADRVRTACELYRDGRAPLIVFSGGPGDGGVHETESMRRYALRLGVPDDAIVLDPGGITTRASVRSTVPMLAAMDARRVIAVSHFYHLPRIKMTYQRAGLDVYTVPAREQYTLSRMPWYVTREVACWWLYYLRSIAS